MTNDEALRYAKALGLTVYESPDGDLWTVVAHGKARSFCGTCRSISGAMDNLQEVMARNGARLRTPAEVGIGAAVSLRRELIVTPADGPAGVFYLIFRVWGPGGVIQVKVMSYWFPPIEMVNSNLPLVVASDSSCHAYEPQFDGNESAECTLLEGGRCYLGHDFFMPRDAERILLDEGSEGVFRELEASYRQLLGKEATTDET